MPNIYKTLMVAGSAAALAVAAPAFAQGEAPVIVEGGRPTAVVSYADLNLASNSGVATLNGRVSRAASNICVSNTRKDLSAHLAELNCFKSAMAGAKTQIDRAVADSRTQLASSGAIKVAAR